MLPLTNLPVNNCDNSKMLVLATSNGVFTIDIAMIIHIRSSSNYSKLFFSNGKSLVVAKVLGWFEDKLPAATFVRIHRSHIISLLHVRSWGDDGNNKIILCNDTTVDISRRKKGMVLRVFRSRYAA
jgi:two-component system LytT family response regulator